MEEIFKKIAENNLVHPGLVVAFINVPGQPDRIRMVLKCGNVTVEASNPNNPFFVVGMTSKFINEAFETTYQRLSYEVAEQRRGLNSAQLREERGI